MTSRDNYNSMMGKLKKVAAGVEAAEAGEFTCENCSKSTNEYNLSADDVTLCNECFRMNEEDAAQQEGQKK